MSTLSPEQLRSCTKLLKFTRNPQKLLEGCALCKSNPGFLRNSNVISAFMALLNSKQQKPVVAQATSALLSFLTPGGAISAENLQFYFTEGQKKTTPWVHFEKLLLLLQESHYEITSNILSLLRNLAQGIDQLAVNKSNLARELYEKLGDVQDSVPLFLHILQQDDYHNRLLVVELCIARVTGVGSSLTTGRDELMAGFQTCLTGNHAEGVLIGVLRTLCTNAAKLQLDGTESVSGTLTPRAAKVAAGSDQAQDALRFRIVTFLYILLSGSKEEKNLLLDPEYGSAYSDCFLNELLTTYLKLEQQENARAEEERLREETANLAGGLPSHASEGVDLDLANSLAQGSQLDEIAATCAPLERSLAVCVQFMVHNFALVEQAKQAERDASVELTFSLAHVLKSVRTMIAVIVRTLLLQSSVDTINVRRMAAQAVEILCRDNNMMEMLVEDYGMPSVLLTQLRLESDSTLGDVLERTLHAIITQTPMRALEAVEHKYVDKPRIMNAEDGLSFVSLVPGLDQDITKTPADVLPCFSYLNLLEGDNQPITICYGVRLLTLILDEDEQAKSKIGDKVVASLIQILQDWKPVLVANPGAVSTRSIFSTRLGMDVDNQEQLVIRAVACLDMLLRETPGLLVPIVKENNTNNILAFLHEALLFGPVARSDYQAGIKETADVIMFNPGVRCIGDFDLSTDISGRFLPAVPWEPNAIEKIACESWSEEQDGGVNLSSFKGWWEILESHPERPWVEYAQIQMNLRASVLNFLGTMLEVREAAVKSSSTGESVNIAFLGDEFMQIAVVALQLIRNSCHKGIVLHGTGFVGQLPVIRGAREVFIRHIALDSCTSDGVLNLSDIKLPNVFPDVDKSGTELVFDKKAMLGFKNLVKALLRPLSGADGLCESGKDKLLVLKAFRGLYNFCHTQQNTGSVSVAHDEVSKIILFFVLRQGGIAVLLSSSVPVLAPDDIDAIEASHSESELSIESKEDPMDGEGAGGAGDSAQETNDSVAEAKDMVAEDGASAASEQESLADGNTNAAKVGKLTLGGALEKSNTVVNIANSDCEEDDEFFLSHYELLVSSFVDDLLNLPKGDGVQLPSSTPAPTSNKKVKDDPKDDTAKGMDEKLTKEKWVALLNRTVDLPRCAVEQCSALLACILFSKAKIAKRLLEYGVDPNLGDSSGRSPLMVAVCSSLTELTNALVLQFGANLDASSAQGWNALKYALVGSTNPLETSKLLLDHGADPNIADDAGDYPLHWVSAGVETTTKFNGREITLSTSGVAMDTRVQLVDMYLKHGARIDVVNKMGRSAVHASVCFNCAAVALKLLDSGANPNIVDEEGNLALHLLGLGVCGDAANVLEALLRRGEGRAVIEKSFMDFGRGLGPVEKKKLLISLIMDETLENLEAPRVVNEVPCTKVQLANYANKDGWAPIHVVCSGRLSINDRSMDMYWLQHHRHKSSIEANTDSTVVSSALPFSETMLQSRCDLLHAMLRGDPQTKLSLCSPNLRGRLQMTPMMLVGLCCRASDMQGDVHTITQRAIELADTLIEAGGKIDAVDARGLAALHYSLVSSDELAWHLIYTGANSLPFGSSIPTLHLAIREADTDARVVNYLLMHNNMGQVDASNLPTPLSSRRRKSTSKILNRRCSIDNSSHSYVPPGNTSQGLIGANTLNVRSDVSMLQQYGHDLRYCGTALMLAAEMGDTTVLKSLLDAKHDTNIARVVDGCTALHIACQYGHLQCVTMLVHHPHTDKYAQDSSGDMPVSKAVLHDHFNVVYYFVEVGDVVHDYLLAKNKDGLNALQLAEKRNMMLTKEFLNCENEEQRQVLKRHLVQSERIVNCLLKNSYSSDIIEEVAGGEDREHESFAIEHVHECFEKGETFSKWKGLEFDNLEEDAPMERFVQKYAPLSVSLEEDEEEEAEGVDQDEEELLVLNESAKPSLEKERGSVGAEIEYDGPPLEGDLEGVVEAEAKSAVSA